MTTSMPMIKINDFDRKTFLKLILLSLVLNLVWDVIATLLERLNGRDKGFISGLGYLIVYGLTFFLCMEKARQTVSALAALIFSFIGIYLISSFLIFPVIVNIDHLFNSDIIGLAASTLFSSILIVVLVSRYFSIQFKFLTGAFTFIAALITTVIVSKIIKGPDYFDLKVFQSLSIFYTAWQVVTTTTIALGVAIK